MQQGSECICMSVCRYLQAQRQLYGIAWSQHVSRSVSHTSDAFAGLRIWCSKKPKERACSATSEGRAMLLFPRPLGRSGCVTTAATYRAESLG